MEEKKCDILHGRQNSTSILQLYMTTKIDILLTNYLSVLTLT